MPNAKLQPYTCPLRVAVLAVSCFGEPFDVDTIARNGVASRGQARAYATRLVRRGVLVARDRGLYGPGPGYGAFLIERTRSRPGGNRVVQTGLRRPRRAS